MTDNTASPPNVPEDASPEEVEAAMHAHASDALTSAQAELAALQAKSAELADQYLRAKADALVQVGGGLIMIG